MSKTFGQVLFEEHGHERFFGYAWTDLNVAVQQDYQTAAEAVVMAVAGREPEHTRKRDDVIEAAKLCVAHNYTPEHLCDAVRWGALKLAVEALEEVEGE